VDPQPPQPPEQPQPPPGAPGFPPPPSAGPWGDPGQWQPAAPQAEQPQSILTAVRLMYCGAALQVIGIVLTLIQRDEIRDKIIENDSTLSKDEVDSALAAGLAFAVILGFVGAGLWVWMAVANGQGKNWARTTATVFGGLNVLFTLIGLGMGQSTPMQIVMSLIGLALAVTILILLYRPDANRFYMIMSGRTGY
jgi:hypothetical protein